MKQILTSLLFLFLLIHYTKSQDSFAQQVNMPLTETDKLVRSGPDDIYIHLKGTGNSVVFVSGIGDDHKNWEQVQNAIAPFAQTISYDRSGIGKSSYKRKKKELVAMAIELRATLQSAKISKPYVLVGHSLGCQIIKQFAAMFPKEVKGIVFIDPSINEELLELSLKDSLWQQREAELKKQKPKIGIAREEELKEHNKNCAIADDIISLPEIPVVLFTATKANEDIPGNTEEVKVKMQSHNRWLETIPGAKHIIVAESTHYIQNDTPELVIDEIKKML